MAKLMTTKLTWLVLIGLCTQALAVDVVTRRSDGTAFRGKITQATRESITLTRSGGQKEVFSVDDLKSVSFDGEPRQIAQARTNERSGAIDAAIATLTEVRRSGAASGKAVRAEVEFLLARMKTRQALVDAEKVEDALAATDAFRRANSNNFRYLEATLLQASLLSLKKDTDKARTLLQEVQTSTVKGFQLQAGVDMGRLMLNSGDPALARAAFDDVISKATDASAQWPFALMLELVERCAVWPQKISMEPSPNWMRSSKTLPQQRPLCWQMRGTEKAIAFGCRINTRRP